MIHYLRMLALHFLMDYREGQRVLGDYAAKRYLGQP